MDSIAHSPHLADWMPWSVEGPSRHRQLAFIESSIAGEAEGHQFNFAAWGSFGLMGSCGLKRRDASTFELGYWTDGRFLRQGVAAAMVRGMLEIARALGG